ncbi:MAG: hypothetical protein L0177_06545, partial [Chloroflexi bacterium]|nr:hypothetical protein [Chloroflexota bacterium]
SPSPQSSPVEGEEVTPMAGQSLLPWREKARMRGELPHHNFVDMVLAVQTAARCKLNRFDRLRM